MALLDSAYADDPRALPTTEPAYPAAAPAGPPPPAAIPGAPVARTAAAAGGAAADTALDAGADPRTAAAAGAAAGAGVGQVAQGAIEANAPTGGAPTYPEPPIPREVVEDAAKRFDQSPTGAMIVANAMAPAQRPGPGQASQMDGFVQGLTREVAEHRGPDRSGPLTRPDWDGYLMDVTLSAQRNLSPAQQVQALTVVDRIRTAGLQRFAGLAVAAAQSGDMEGAARALNGASNFMPDGYLTTFSAGPGGVVMNRAPDGTTANTQGQPSASVTVPQDQLVRYATAMMDPHWSLNHFLNVDKHSETVRHNLSTEANQRAATAGAAAGRAEARSARAEEREFRRTGQVADATLARATNELGVAQDEERALPADASAEDRTAAAERVRNARTAYREASESPHVTGTGVGRSASMRDRDMQQRAMLDNANRAAEDRAERTSQTRQTAEDRRTAAAADATALSANNALSEANDRLNQLPANAPQEQRDEAERVQREAFRRAREAVTNPAVTASGHQRIRAANEADQNQAQREAARQEARSGRSPITAAEQTAATNATADLAGSRDPVTQRGAGFASAWTGNTLALNRGANPDHVAAALARAYGGDGNFTAHGTENVVIDRQTGRTYAVPPQVAATIRQQAAARTPAPTQGGGGQGDGTSTRGARPVPANPQPTETGPQSNLRPPGGTPEMQAAAAAAAQGQTGQRGERTQAQTNAQTRATAQQARNLDTAVADARELMRTGNISAAEAAQAAVTSSAGRRLGVTRQQVLEALGR